MHDNTSMGIMNNKFRILIVFSGGWNSIGRASQLNLLFNIVIFKPIAKKIGKSLRVNRRDGWVVVVVSSILSRCCHYLI